MRKKYLSALLFGALLMTSAGTFTSCKDYDDEINNLQEQVDKLATKEDMEAKLSQMQAAIDAAKKTAEDALAKAESIEGGVDNSEEVAKLTERVAALEEAMKKVETLKEEIKSMVDDQLADFRVEMEEFMKEVEELTGYSLTMVTGVSFVYPDNLLNVNYARIENIYVPKSSYYDANGNVVAGQDDNRNNFEAKTSYTFGAGFAGEFTVKTKDVNTVVDNVLVKVDPVNTAISADMLTLINGKGESIDSYLDLSVNPWSGDIVTRNSSTGLYQVGVKLKNNVDFEAFDKMVLPTAGSHIANGCTGAHGYNLFALGINDSEKSRLVTSDYAISLHVQEETEAKEINFLTTLVSSAKTSTIAEHSIAGNNDNDCFEIVLGEAFDVNVNSKGGRVMASYIVVDENNKSLSSTDKVAIKSLDIDGVKTVSRDLKHSIKVSGEAGVAVPMKLVTIDYTGVVKENIFWVKASTPTLMTAEFTMIPTTFVNNGKAWDASSIEDKDRDKQAFKIPAGTTTYKFNLVAGEEYGASVSKDYTQYAGDMNLANNALCLGGEEILKLYNANKVETSKVGDVAYAAFVGTLNLQGMREDKTYTGVIKFFNGDNYLGSNTITVTKKLPTDVPADFSAKTNAINNGVLTIYPEPTSDSNKNGKYNLVKSFNNFAVSNNTSTNPKELGYLYYIDKVTPGKAEFSGILQSLLDINPNIIDSKTEYASAITYNYGNIKFVPTGHGVDADANHTVEWSTKFATKFGWWALDCVYNWTEEPVVYYRETNIIKGKVTKDANGNVTAFDNVISVKTPYGGIADPFDATDADWTTWTEALNANNVKITLYTMNNGTRVANEFFTAKFDVVTEGKYSKNAMVLTPVSKEVQLSGDVETEVVLEFTDKFGKTCEVSALKFTMKKDHK